MADAPSPDRPRPPLTSASPERPMPPGALTPPPYRTEREELERVCTVEPTRALPFPAMSYATP